MDVFDPGRAGLIRQDCHSSFRVRLVNEVVRP
jgi:hypothetical protein